MKTSAEETGEEASGTLPTWLSDTVREGRLIGGCRLLECIKDGERGTLFRAEHVDSRRPAVVKIPVREFVWKRITTAMLEALVLSYVRHPSIVRIAGAGRDRDADYLVLEYIPGHNLDQVLQREGPLPPAKAARLLVAAADALAEVHRRGVIHCDLKPGNLMRTPGGDLKLVDFGLARFPGSGAWPFGEGVITASPHYMSLEQAEGRPLDCRTDIYSLGATFYHALTGVPPYGNEDFDTLRRYVAEPPAPLRASVPGVPKGLADILDRMMSRRREDRYGSMTEVRDTIAAWLKGQGQHAA